MGVAPSSYVNSPSAGTQYFSKVWSGCVVTNGDPITVTAKAWTGANGTGSLIAVTNFEAWVWDWNTNASVGHFGPGAFNTVSASHTANAGEAGHYFYVAAKFSSGSPGSIEFFTTFGSSNFFWPGTPSFTPTLGGPGTSVAITGVQYTDATGVDFNGTAASFTVNSDTSITATVPTGATVGQIHVTNGVGTVGSVGNFQPSTFRVANGTAWDTANAVWGDDGAAWQRCKVWVDNGTSWVQIT